MKAKIISAILATLFVGLLAASIVYPEVLVAGGLLLIGYCIYQLLLPEIEKHL
jgi:hypothetical protein